MWELTIWEHLSTDTLPIKISIASSFQQYK